MPRLANGLNLSSPRIPARPAQFDRSTQRRRAMMAMLHIAPAQINMVEDDYRQGLFNLTGKTSAKDCTDEQLDKVVKWLESKGFRRIARGSQAGQSAATHKVAMKARALWISLHHLGVVHNPAEEALEAFAKRQFGCEKLAWIRQSEGYQLIEALKDMGIRNGWRMTDSDGKPLRALGLQRTLCEAILAKLKAYAIALDDWRLDTAAMRLCGIDIHAEPFDSEFLTRLATALGKVLRERAPAEVAL